MINEVAIIGLGLIGGSIGLGLKSQADRGNVRVVAFDKDQASLKLGLELGVIDRIGDSIADAVRNADLVILSVPVLATKDVLEELKAAECKAVITDVGSVKQPIFEAFAAVYGAVPLNFIAGHPIAGSERHGVDAAKKDLFHQHRVLLTPHAEADPKALKIVEELWDVLGADVSQMSAEHHDMVLGQTSHLPHLLAYSLIDTLSAQGDSLEIFDYAAGGLRDFSRIAASDPKMWSDIFMSNRSALLKILDQFSTDLDELRSTIETGDSNDLFTRLGRSKAARDHFAEVLLRRTMVGSTQVGKAQADSLQRSLPKSTDFEDS